MKVIVIEDEALAAEKLEGMIRRYDPEIELLPRIKSVEEAVQRAAEFEEVDLLFLDIHLLDGTCFDILQSCPIHCPVIFTTAYDEYALRAFELHSIDYLLKPVSYLKLEAALKKFENLKTTLNAGAATERPPEWWNKLREPVISYKSRFLVKSGSRILSISVEEIAYFFSEDKITFLVTWKKKKYSIEASLEQVEEKLDPRAFFRINRQAILHIDSILVVHPFFNNRLKVDLNPPPPFEPVVSSRRVAGFKEWLDK